MRPDVSTYFKLEEKIGEKGVVITSFMDPLGALSDLMGPEKLAIWSITKRKMIVHLLDMISLRIQNYLKYLLDNNVKPIFWLVGPEYCTAPMHSPKDFSEFVVAYDSKLINLIHKYGALVVIHCHGNLRLILEMIISMKPNGLHPIETIPYGDVTLAEVKKKIGDRVCLIGNIQYDNICQCSKEEIKQKVKETIQAGASNGGFILAVSCMPHAIYEAAYI